MTSHSALQALMLAAPALGAALRALRWRLAQAGRAVWRALEAYGEARAARELRLPADRA